MSEDNFEEEFGGFELGDSVVDVLSVAGAGEKPHGEPPIGQTHASTGASSNAAMKAGLWSLFACATKSAQRLPSSCTCLEMRTIELFNVGS